MERSKFDATIVPLMEVLNSAAEEWTERCRPGCKYVRNSASINTYEERVTFQVRGQAGITMERVALDGLFDDSDDCPRAPGYKSRNIVVNIIKAEAPTGSAKITSSRPERIDAEFTRTASALWLYPEFSGSSVITIMFEGGTPKTKIRKAFIDNKLCTSAELIKLSDALS